MATLRDKLAEVFGRTDLEKGSSPSTKMALALAAKSARDGGRTYEGTVPRAVVVRRRAKGKAARVARRAGRR
jgi:hypothetical protein